jgi:putative transposase
MASVLGVSKVGYYQFLKEKQSKRSEENERLLKKIKEIHQSSHETYGSPRIHAELKDLGESCSAKSCKAYESFPYYG